MIESVNEIKFKAEVVWEKSFAEVVKANQTQSSQQNSGIKIKDVRNLLKETNFEVKEQEMRDRSFMLYIIKKVSQMMVKIQYPERMLSL